MIETLTEVGKSILKTIVVLVGLGVVFKCIYLLFLLGWRLL